MAGASVTKTAKSFGVAKSTVSKVMAAFEKEGKTSKLKQNFGRKCGSFGRITRIQLQKLQQSLMTISRTQFPQKLFEGSYTKLGLKGGLQPAKNLKFPGVSIILSKPCIYKQKKETIKIHLILINPSMVLACLFVCLFVFYGIINLCRLFNAKSIFIQIKSSISNNSV